MKLIFYMEIKKPFYKLMLSILLSIAIYAQSIQKMKLIQYLKKVVSDEVDFLYNDKHQNFLHADKHQIFLQVGTHFFMVFTGLASHV